MAITKGHGNPRWTRDEVILALDLYFDCDGKIPNSTDVRVMELSQLLRSFPHHSVAARKESFRNSDGVGFKLQNLRQVATGKGLGNVSRMDREVWDELGNDPKRTRALANLIRFGIRVVENSDEGSASDEVFAEGKVVTESHIRRERDPRLRKRLLEQRRKAGKLTCDVCGCESISYAPHLAESMFEAHHVVPLAVGLDRETRLRDMALLCANCHRMVHRAIAQTKRWLSLDEARIEILGQPHA